MNPLAYTIIPDQKYQQLNMSFTYDDQYEDRLVINAHVDFSIYQAEFNQQFGFSEVKDLLENKNFKILQHSAKILRLQVGDREVGFYNGNKHIENQENLNKLVEQMTKRQQENKLLKEITTQLRKEINSITTKITDQAMKQSQKQKENLSLKQQLLKATNKITDVEKQLKQLLKTTTKLNQVQKKLKSQKQVINQQKIQITQLKNKISTQNTLINRIKFDTIKKVTDIIQAQKEEIKPFKNSSFTNAQTRPESSQKPSHRTQYPEQNDPKKNGLKELSNKLISQIQLAWEIKQNSSRTDRSFNQMNQIKKNNVVLQQKIQYKFSNYLKNSLIQLSENDTQASCNMFVGFALVDGFVKIKGSSIKFKIDKLTTGLDVGLGIRNIIVENKYEFKNANKTGHGAFLLENDGRLFSHSIELINNKNLEQNFYEGDIIEVTTNDYELVFRKEAQNWEYRMSISLTAKQWNQACFCVYLSKGNAVQIVL